MSVYGRYTPIQLEARDLSVCASCKTKDCIQNSNRQRFDKRSCPSLLIPFKRQASDGCVLCLQCAKVCPYDNMGFGLVSRDAGVRRKAQLKPFEAAFVMIALGFVAHEVIGEVKWLDSYVHTVPNLLHQFVPAVSFGWLEAVWFLVLLPLLVWSVIVGVGGLADKRIDLKTQLLAVATGAAPVVAVAHLAKAVAKISSWGGFLPLAIDDPIGAHNFRSIADNLQSPPEGILGLSMVGWVMLLLSLIIAWRAWKWAYQVPAESKTAARVGLVGSAVLFGTIMTTWVWVGF